MCDTPTGPPVEPASALPVVAATAYPPGPGYTQTTLIAEHTACGRHHRHVTSGLATDDLVRYPPCRTGPYRLAVAVAAPPRSCREPS